MPERLVTQFGSMLQHPVFLSAFFSWLIAQCIKGLTELLKRRTRSSKEVMVTIFWATGGMPSSHSAVVAALATSIAFIEGVSSSLFILALFYGILTVRDALGVRRAAGSQALVLNQLSRDLAKRLGMPSRTVKEVHGHTTSEVSVGVLLGFFIAVAFSSL
jgi:hypothetical protein